MRKSSDFKYYVQTSELVSKLIKEMEDHKVSRAAGDLVCNYYTVFLCPEDFAHFQARMESAMTKLQQHLSKYVRKHKYILPADLTVRIVMDADLALGRFGILAERFDPSRVAAANGSVASQPAEVLPASSSTPTPPAVSPLGRSSSREGGPVPRRKSTAEDSSREGSPGPVIVLKAGGRVREFTGGRVIVGRSWDVDFRVDNPDVSRRHAAIYWDDGRLVVQDLNSTNGTMVNGYPVSSTVLRSTDIVAIGDCRITVETR